MGQRRRLSKKGIVLIVAVILAILTAVVLIFSTNFKKTEMSDSFYENMDIFGIEAQEDSVSALDKAYLEHVSYEILEQNEETMTAKVKIPVPVLSDNLKTEINSIEIDEETATEKLQAQIEEVIMEAITHAEETRQKEIELPLIEQNGENCIVTNSEMYEFIYEDFRTMYYDYLLLAIGGETDENEE